MTLQNTAPNDEQFTICNWGTEAERGTPVVPTFGMYGKMALTTTRGLTDDDEYNGTLMGDIDPTYGPKTVGGAYDQSLTYEDLEILTRYDTRGGVQPVSDGATPPAWTLGPVYPDISRDNLDSICGETGVPGLPWGFDGVNIDQYTISWDADDAKGVWKYSAKLIAMDNAPKAAIPIAATGGSTTTVVKTAAGWLADQYAGSYVTVLTGAAAGNIRYITTNTPTTLTVTPPFSAAVAAADTVSISAPFTPGIVTRVRERIATPGMQHFIDPGVGSTIGTTLRTDQVLSGSITVMNAVNPKRFTDNLNGISKLKGRGLVRVTGQVRVEFNTFADYLDWLAKKEFKMRVQQFGSDINTTTSTKKMARLDLTRAFWDQPSPDKRDNNLTQTLTFRGYYDKTNAKFPFARTVVSTLAALP